MFGVCDSGNASRGAVPCRREVLLSGILLQHTNERNVVLILTQRNRCSQNGGGLGARVKRETEIQWHWYSSSLDETDERAWI